jgi:hypothetical protein
MDRKDGMPDGEAADVAGRDQSIRAASCSFANSTSCKRFLD